MSNRITVGVLGAAVLATAAFAHPIPATAQGTAAQTAEAALTSPEGESLGTVTLRPTPYGTLLHAKLTGLPPGVHAFHVHETGTCEPPDFKSAGGHFNPAETGHGFLDDDGVHVGDMPNIHVPDSGALEIEVFNAALVLDDALFDDDGAAIVIHEGADDYETNPAGAAGARIACGVIERPN